MLMNWDPFTEMARWNRALARPTRTVGFRPAVDVFEGESGYVLTAEVPGVAAEDLDIQVENGALTMRGERKLENVEERDGYTHVERSYGSFVRTFTLPDTADSESVEAELKDGVLTLRIPKLPKATPKKITVASA